MLRWDVPMAADRWYTVETKPRCEDRVALWLQRRALAPVFLPRLESVRRLRDRNVHRVSPLFPSYLFVRISAESRQWDAVRWTPGVKDIVRMAGVSVPIPDDAIEVLKARCQARGYIPWESKLRRDSQVRIIDGPFAGLQGILEQTVSGRERVRVLLTLMRTAASVEVDITNLEEVSA
jgi:transcription elongation factor/antiterminator RfaH